MRAFHDVPAEVAALLQDVNFFPAVLAYVGDEQAIGDRLKGKAPGIAQPVGIDFGQPTTANEGIVRWNRVLQASG